MDLPNLEVHVFVILEVNAKVKDAGRINGDLELLSSSEREDGDYLCQKWEPL